MRVRADLAAGRLLVVPVANPPAFAARTRTTPSDGANLARCFPGRPDGNDTERIADVLAGQVIAPADLLIDLHSAGAAYSMPVFVGCVGGDGAVAERSVAAATVFGAPLGWQHAVMNPGRSLSVALDLGIPGIYVEGGGGAALVGAEVACYVDGVLDVLATGGQLAARPPRPPTSRWVIGGDGDVDASLSTPVAGWCVTAVAAGDSVVEGQVIAEVIDGDAEVAARVVAPRDATVMMLRRHAEVAAGDGIAMLGPVTSDR
jgi:predicted deacylase